MIRLTILAAFAIMLGQVVAMPSAILSLAGASFDQQSSLTQAVPEQDEPGLPCHHHGNAQGSVCCITGGCPMLTLTLPVTPSTARPTAFRPLVYRHDAVSSRDGMTAAPLLPPPRYLV